MAYTTQNLLDAIEKRSFMPSNQNTFTTAEQLLMADEEARTLVVPEILKLREDYLTVSLDYTTTASEQTYEIPPRSSGLTVREIHLLNSNNDVKDLSRTEIDRIKTYATGTPDSFYIQGNQIYLYPSPSAGGDTLRVYYPLRPSSFVQTTETAIITSIDTDNSIITCSGGVPSAWATGDIFDLKRDNGGQESWALDQTSTLVSGTSITFASLPSDLAVGDYVSLAGETSLVQFPAEYRDILAQAVATTMLTSMSAPGSDRAMKRLESMILGAREAFDNRTPGENRVVINEVW
jgi:hypothetical protein